MKPQTYNLLEKAPKDHLSEEFITFLRNNNLVVEENEDWLVIKNCKRPDRLTAFSKYESTYQAWHSMASLYMLLDVKYASWEWKKKPARKQTVKRFHVHITK